MDAWVYVLSKFTQEAMLFEALVLFLGFAAYGAYFVTRKRKYGVAQSEVPSNLVKVYLAQLVSDAEDLRIQLFGLLGRGSVAPNFLNSLGQSGAHTPAPHVTSSHTTQVVTQADPLLLEKMKALEAKMFEQAKALENVLNEKTRLEQELALARANTGGAPAAPAEGGDGNADRVRHLEAQLAEYAIIEDDLANLKRLQRENKALREQVEKAAGGTIPEPVAVTAAPPATASTPNPTPTASLAPAEVAPPIAAIATTPEATNDASKEAEMAAAQPDFEALVDQVEKSLDEVPPGEAAATTEAAAAVAAAVPEGSTPPKTEKELQDEFEKMLNA